MERLYLFTVFERLWHWFQVIVVSILLFTGFDIHGSYHLMSFKSAVEIHNTAGLVWAVGNPFWLFWLMITGQWAHYVPTSSQFFETARYYAWDIFWNRDHPFEKTESEKHNPIQRLAYLGLFLFIAPVQIVTGILYWQWSAVGLTFGGIKMTATIHILFAFAVLGFVIVHIYMITTGKTLLEYARAMVTGFKEVHPKIHTADAESSPAESDGAQS